MAGPARRGIADWRRSGPVILPSLLLCDFADLRSEIGKLERAGVRGLHLDVMDGQFVPNLTYGMTIVSAVRSVTDLPLDVHLMIEQPERYVDAFAKAGADHLTIHVEATRDPQGVLGAIHDAGLSAGLAINPSTDLSAAGEAWRDCDLALVMSVEAGFGGQSFQRAMLDRARRVREFLPDAAVLEMDGGIDLQTIDACVAAGAEALVIGSAIFRQPDYGGAIAALSARASSSR